MKKLYALAVLLSAAFGAQAQSQRQISNAPALKGPVFEQATGIQPLAIVDSILTPKFFDTNGDAYCDTSRGYFATSGGFLSGNNGYGDREKLMKFTFPASGTVTNVQISVLKYTTAGTGTTPVTAVVYGVDADGYPDTANRVLSTPITMRNLPANGFARFVFANAAIFDTTFFVGLVLPQTPGDTILVFQSALPVNRHPGNCASSDSAGYERAADGSFVRLSDSWGINFELSMAPAIRYDDVIATKDLLGKLVSVSPVPASQAVKVSLPANIAGATTWQILSADGRVVNASSAIATGNLVSVTRGSLPAGVYTLRLSTAGGPVNKRIVFAD